ncbi:phage holin protein [Salmonella enterica subsp. indica]|uniref:Phage holin protein n=2 Tax=Salmonella enterica TaxID=28901 RepID=A0A379XM35_SALER|nr:phage holin protein [Salmonella enterica subsp. indica]
MTEGEKGVLSLFVIGALIVVGKVLAGGEPITPRLFIGRMLLGGFVSMVAGVVLVQFPDMSLPAVCGIGSMLGIAGYQVVEIAIQRRFKSQKGGRRCRSLILTRISPPFWTCWRIPKERRTIR